ncbi:fungal-specific transcription factor domain-containing protein [Aspergillus karnatakaensis]|uniref:Zn(II)2Cys6 transcription factor n=1 Tax=Aspergillus karnatakaensis TaxID=1810916 RepID=UPI003CCD18F9
MSDQKPRNRIKTRKTQRIKCDENYPSCNQCTRRSFECPGYRRPLKWSSKYELTSDAVRLPPGSGSRITRKSGALKTSLDDAAFSLSLPVSDPAAPIDVFSESAYLLPLSSAPELNAEDIISTPMRDDLPYDAAPQHLPELTSSELSTNWTQWADFSLLSPLAPPLEDQDTKLLRHYFVRVCRINSCYDSDRNFFRSEAARLLASSSLIYHCVLSMSAAHLAAAQQGMGATALHHRANAISCLKSEITLIKRDAPIRDSLVTPLLGSILLGMTEAWHNPTFVGATHLHGARILFQRWLAAEDQDSDLSTPAVASVRDFLTGTMAYWEAMNCFLLNQSSDSINYLERVVQYNQSTRYRPNPWSGICTPLFVYLSQTGTLARQRSMLKQMSSIAGSTSVQKDVHGGLISSARGIESALVQYQVPCAASIEDTNDPLTPIPHLQRIAQVYKLATQVELYRNFPELLDEVSGSKDGLTPAAKIFAMAISSLNLIAAIPPTSGVNCLITIPLIISGSSLQCYRSSHPVIPRGTSPWHTIATDIVCASSDPDVQLYWRDFVRGRLHDVRQYVGLPVILRALEILENVWTRCDVQAALSSLIPATNSGDDFVQWLEVMVEEKLEGIYG